MLVSFSVKIEYYSLFIFFLVSLVLGLVIFILSYLLITQKVTVEKVSSYECGFDPFGDARNPFNIHFYIVGILFIVFDLEIMYLFPWALTLDFTNSYGFLVIFFFLLILTVGFFYEWLRGALNWF